MTVTTTLNVENVRTEFVVNANSVGGSQNLSNVIGLANGGYAVVYGTDSGSNDFPNVVIYDSPGDVTPVDFDPTLDTTVDMQGEPVITRLPNGNVAVAWAEGPGGANRILVTVFDPATGVAVLEEVQIPIDGATDPEIVALPNGNLLVTATTPGAGGGVVMTPGGAFLGGITLATSNATDISVAVLAGGRIAFAYSDGTNVKAELFEANGTPVAGVGVITVATGGASSPQIAALPFAGFAVVYDDDSFSAASPTPGIGMKIFSDDGVDATPAPIRIDVDANLDSSKQDFDPEITILGNGFTLVTYTHESSAGDRDIFGRMFDGFNTVQFGGLNLFPIDVSGFDTTQSSAAGLGSGQFVTTWTDEESDGSGDRISGRVQELVSTSVSNADPDLVVGSDLRDILQGGDGADVLEGNSGRDDLFGGPGNDKLGVGDGDVQAGETYVGGGDFDTLQLFGTGASVLDFRGSTVADLDHLLFTTAFGGGATAHFDVAQFPFGSVGFAIQVSGARIVSLAMGAQTGLDLSALIIQGTPGPGDRFEVAGDDADETIIGSVVDDVIDAGGGGDQIDGREGQDVLRGGGGADLLLGGLGNDVLKGGAGNDEIDGGDGSDRVDWSDATGDIVFAIDPFGPASVFATGIGTDLVSNIEQVIGGSGNDILTGSIGAAIDNILNGGSGNDRLAGGRGNDTLNGGTGIDTANFIAATGALIVTLDATGHGTASATGIDTDTFFGIENIIGGSAGDRITGNDLANLFDGGGGDDTLDGAVGADTLTGGGGNDFLFVDNAADKVIEAGGGGADRVLASVSYTLGAGQEVETMSTTSNGGTTAINLTGNERANTIFGNAGANSLDGKAGADFLIGFGGNDFFFVDNAADAITEGAGQGTGDRVLASVSYTLGAGDQVEIMSTANNAGTGAINLTGNEFVNTIFGNAGANTLDGKAGADSLVGFGGNDFFFVDNAADAITEGAGQGTGDRVFASVNYTLGAGDQVEIMSTTNNGGAGALNLTGNEFANTIFGNAGANTLRGQAGADSLTGFGGNDRLEGGADSDTYDAGAGANVVFDTGGASDTIRVASLAGIQSSVRTGDDLLLTFADASTIRVEKHFLAANTIEFVRDATQTVVLATGTVGGPGNGIISGTSGPDVLDGGGGDDIVFGGNGRDVLKGGAGNDRLDGGSGRDRLDGGAGDDSLTGGFGRDVYVFAPGPAGGGNDVVRDFDRWEDRIDLTAFDTRFRRLDDDRDGRLEHGEGDRNIAVRIEDGDTVLAFAGGSIRIEDATRLHAYDFIF